jgi:hypothetical protein
MICLNRETLDKIDPGLSQIQTGISNSDSISPWKRGSCDLRTNFGGNAQTRVSSPKQSVNALRAYLDEKGFKTAIIDDNLVIAGKLTWTEVFEPIRGIERIRPNRMRPENCLSLATQAFQYFNTNHKSFLSSCLRIRLSVIKGVGLNRFAVCGETNFQA